MNAKEELTKLLMESYDKGVEDAMQAALEGMQKAVLLEREAVIGLLRGINETETESEDGWWETSTGAEFGARILAAIRARGDVK
jgi:hypothetical protein